MSDTKLKLVLGSSSPFRRQLLEAAGFEPECISPNVDEDQLKAQKLHPERLAEGLATLKAEAVVGILGARAKTSLVIGSDQVAHLGDQIFSKPGTTERALQTLSALSGKTHQLITSVCLLTHEKRVTFTNVTKLTMRPLTREQIERSIEQDQPLNCAGSYMLERGGIKLFEKIESEDFTAIQGLPMITLTNEILKLSPTLCF